MSLASTYIFQPEIQNKLKVRGHRGAGAGKSVYDAPYNNLVIERLAKFCWSYRDIHIGRIATVG